jgi:hypothetical protein
MVSSEIPKAKKEFALAFYIALYYLGEKLI